MGGGEKKSGGKEEFEEFQDLIGSPIQKERQVQGLNKREENEPVQVKKGRPFRAKGADGIRWPRRPTNEIGGGPGMVLLGVLEDPRVREKGSRRVGGILGGTILSKTEKSTKHLCGRQRRQEASPEPSLGNKIKLRNSNLTNHALFRIFVSAREKKHGNGWEDLHRETTTFKRSAKGVIQEAGN